MATLAICENHNVASRQAFRRGLTIYTMNQHMFGGNLRSEYIIHIRARRCGKISGTKHIHGRGRIKRPTPQTAWTHDADFIQSHHPFTRPASWHLQKGTTAARRISQWKTTGNHPVNGIGLYTPAV